MTVIKYQISLKFESVKSFVLKSLVKMSENINEILICIYFGRLLGIISRFFEIGGKSLLSFTVFKPKKPESNSCKIKTVNLILRP